MTEFQEFEAYASGETNTRVLANFFAEIVEGGCPAYDKVGITRSGERVFIEEKHRRGGVRHDVLIEYMQDASTGQLGWFWWPEDRDPETVFVYTFFKGGVGSELQKAYGWRHSSMRGFVGARENWMHLKDHTSEAGRGLTKNHSIPIEVLIRAGVVRELPVAAVPAVVV